ncbi:hypothetical protein AXF42_Ash003680 [Apostasia shenzhenica]|uniref:DUF674 domain-containing protein n=1 Tax=Apostasia shenzhenica TaxID=1088818 RepID=A0A2I0AHL2_9ASPA|nr:hypothetical protein AXF42_Ash003680 [Apostasia shenzhenica]
MAEELFTVRLMVDRSCNRVVFAESDGRFVDILMSFLTYPLATILRLTGNQVPFGSMNKLYESVASVDSRCLCSEACRSMLLDPIYLAAEECSRLPINIDEKHDLCCYICSDPDCDAEYLSFYANAQCSCGSSMAKKVRFSQSRGSTVKSEAGVFVVSSLGFMISDDLVVSQHSLVEICSLFARLGIEQGRNLEAMDVNLTADVITELLKRILVSDSPLTDVFLGEPKEKGKLMPLKNHSTHQIQARTSRTKPFSVKLMLNENGKKLVFAEADDEFVNLLVSYLTYPMGLVEKKLEGRSGIRCFDNLYRSIIESLASADCFKGVDLMNLLLNPELPRHLILEKNLLGFSLQRKEKFYICRTYDCDSDQVSTIGNAKCKGCKQISNRRLWAVNGSDGFMAQGRYMVRDDLVVKPLSSVMIVRDFLRQAHGGVQVMSVEIGQEEFAINVARSFQALALLRASVTSTQVLTDALMVGDNEIKSL